jgi:CMP-N,N'-diacetyllegionaminic acid synthase
MIQGKRILVVVPARGGSKGIPLKNLRPVLGVPLVARVGHLIRHMPEIDRAVVSTDHGEIVRVAEQSGLDAPFMRPQDLSGDVIADWQVLLHALEAVEKLDGVTYDIIVMLQPTSPIRDKHDVIGTVNMLVDEGLDAVWTLSETDSKSHPLKQLAVTEGRLDYYDPKGAAIIARQQLMPVYHRNGVAYTMTRRCLVEGQAIKGERTGAYLIEGMCVSIDTEWDIELVEFILKRRDGGAA